MILVFDLISDAWLWFQYYTLRLAFKTAGTPDLEVWRARNNNNNLKSQHHQDLEL